MADTPQDRRRRALAGALSAVAGYTNAVVLLFTGVMISHTTGATTHAAADVVQAPTHGGVGSAAVFAVVVVAFLAGAFLSALLTAQPSRARRTARIVTAHTRRRFRLAILVESLLLALVALGMAFIPPMHPSGLGDPMLLLLIAAAMAMGLQNASMTRLSGTVLRTTHLTGLTTDLGIALADLFILLRHHLRRTIRGDRRARALRRRRVRYVLSRHPAARHARIYAGGIACFALGAAVGAFFYGLAPRLCMFLPTIALPLGTMLTTRRQRTAESASARAAPPHPPVPAAPQRA